MLDFNGVKARGETEKKVLSSYFTYRYGIPVYIDESTATVLAMSSIEKREGGAIWLNGKRQVLTDLQLRLGVIEPD